MEVPPEQVLGPVKWKELKVPERESEEGEDSEMEAMLKLFPDDLGAAVEGEGLDVPGGEGGVGAELGCEANADGGGGDDVLEVVGVGGGDAGGEELNPGGAVEGGVLIGENDVVGDGGGVGGAGLEEDIELREAAGGNGVDQREVAGTEGFGLADGDVGEAAAWRWGRG